MKQVSPPAIANPMRAYMLGEEWILSNLLRTIDVIIEKNSDLLAYRQLIEDRLLSAGREYLGGVYGGVPILRSASKNKLMPILDEIRFTAKKLKKLLAENPSAIAEMHGSALDQHPLYEPMQDALDLVDRDVEAVSSLVQRAEKVYHNVKGRDDRLPKIPKDFDLPRNLFYWRILEMWSDMGFPRTRSVSETGQCSPLVEFARISLLLVQVELNASAVKAALGRLPDYGLKA